MDQLHELKLYCSRKSSHNPDSTKSISPVPLASLKPHSVANIGTPGYRRRGVSFDEKLQKAMNSGLQTLKTTHPRHLPSSDAIKKIKPEVVYIEDDYWNGINNVNIDLVETGKEALEKAQANNYDMILMDVNMPEMDGHEATKAIRLLNNEKKDIPIIALTASVLNTDIHKCLESGMNDYIPKPFKREELLQTLSKYYKSSRI